MDQWPGRADEQHDQEATVKRFHYDSHDQLRTHLKDFTSVYNFARRLKTLNGLMPYQYIFKIWTSEADRFILDPIHRTLGLNTKWDVNPISYRYMADMVLKERERLGLKAYYLHALRYRGGKELAWAGCDDDEIAAYSGHATKEMIAKYAGEARQQMRARQAREKRQ